MMRAWRIKYREPDPREFVSIQYLEGDRFTPPWILSIEDARNLFGKAVDSLSEKAREIKLSMEIVRFGDE